MENFDFAWRIEKQAELTYRVLGKNTSNAWLKHIFSFLANAELRHYETIQRLEAGQSVNLPGSSMLPAVKDALKRKKGQENKLKSATSQIKVFMAVRDNEEASELFYLEKAMETTVEEHRDVFLALAEEEHIHFVLMKGLVELVQNSRAHFEPLKSSLRRITPRQEPMSAS